MKTLSIIALLALALPVSADFAPGTGAEFRSSTNYLIADTLGQFAVGVSYAPDESYSCAIIEHGFWHSDIHIPSIPEIKATPNYNWVDAYAKVVSAGSDQFSKEFFIADQDRSGAIRVYLGNQPVVVQPGDVLDVSGVIKGTDAARYIDYPIVTVRFQNALQLAPFFAPARSLGGKGTDVVRLGGAGALNTSMLMKVAGQVTYVDTSVPCQFFYLDDGSGLSDGAIYGGAIMHGIKVSLASLAPDNSITPPSPNSYVTVTGICAPYSTLGNTLVQLRPRTQTDIVPQ